MLSKMRLSCLLLLPLLALCAGAGSPRAAENKAVEPAVPGHGVRIAAPAGAIGAPGIRPLPAIATPVSPQKATAPQAPQAASPEPLPPTQVAPFPPKGSAASLNGAASPAEGGAPRDFEAAASAGAARFDNAAAKAPQANIPTRAAKQAASLLEKTKDLPVTFLYSQDDGDKRLAKVTFETLLRPDAASAAANLIRSYLNGGNPGLGTKYVTPRIPYLRHANGVRVFFRRGGKGIEVLVISDKGNEDDAFRRLRALYP